MLIMHEPTYYDHMENKESSTDVMVLGASIAYDGLEIEF